MGTLTPEVIQQALEEAKENQPSGLKEHLSVLTKLEEEIAEEKEREEQNETNNVDTIDDMMRNKTQLEKSYANSNQSEQF